MKKKTLDEIRETMIAYSKKQLLSEKERLAKLIKQKEKLEYEIKEISKITTPDKYRQYALQDIQKAIVDCKQSIGAIAHQLSYFESILPNISQSKETCPICLETIVELTITKCAHLFCRACIEAAIETQKKCPMCRTALTLDNLSIVLEETDIKYIEDNTDLQNLIMKHGTKMGHLIQYINKIKNDPITRIIIFSQWDKMLHLIGSTLEENGIKNVYVKGNIHQRNKALLLLHHWMF